MALAAPKKNTSGASIDPNDFFSCMEKSVLGDNEGKCESNGEANQCVGFKRALENSTKNTKCFQSTSNGVCLTHGYLQNTQMQWLSTASGHLAIFHQCVKNHYPDANDASAALNDNYFVEFLRKLDDGSSTLGLQNGEILRRSLSGEKLGTIYATSPEGKKIPTKDLSSHMESANNPIVVETESFVGGSNPSTEGETWFSLKSNFLANYGQSEGPKVFYQQPKKEAQKAAVIKTEAYDRKPANNPYTLGLDKNLFERVNATYQKKLRSLQGIDDYVKSAPTPPPSIKDLIKKGEAYEL